jgi:hypothetical protein
MPLVLCQNFSSHLIYFKDIIIFKYNDNHKEYLVRYIPIIGKYTAKHFSKARIL